MKIKLLILSIILVAPVSFALAQDTTVVKSKHYWGIKGGSNFSQINLDIIDTNPVINSQEFFNGIVGGFVYKHMSEEMFAIQIELLFSQKSGQNYFEKASLPDTLGMPAYIPYSMTLNQIELPFMSVLHFTIGENKLNFLGGPYVAYSFKNTMSFTGETQLEKGFYPETDRDYELGVNAGIGYGRLLKKGMIEAEFRFTQAFTNIYQTKSVNKSIVYQTQALTFAVSYLYNK